jgi:uncharacterized protein YidB (DUF937 family)
VGTGAEAPLSGDQLERVLSRDALATAVARRGKPSPARDGLASLLPEPVNQFPCEGDAREPRRAGEHGAGDAAERIAPC